MTMYTSLIQHHMTNSVLKEKSVFCFVIAPEMKRKGIATLLLERVCMLRFS